MPFLFWFIATVDYHFNHCIPSIYVSDILRDRNLTIIHHSQLISINNVTDSYPMLLFIMNNSVINCQFSGRSGLKLCSLCILSIEGSKLKYYWQSLNLIMKVETIQFSNNKYFVKVLCDLFFEKSRQYAFNFFFLILNSIHYINHYLHVIEPLTLV